MGLLSEEVSATWFATAMLIAVMGISFTNRDSVSAETRRVLDIIFLMIAFFTVLWTMLSYFFALPYVLHRVGMVLIVLATLCTLLYLVYLTAIEAV
jgi:hypothetical protein